MASFVSALRFGGVRPRVPYPDVALSNHMLNLAASMRPGAGEECARPRPIGSRARQVRALVLRCLSGRLWVSKRSIAASIGERFHRPNGAWCKHILAQAVVTLERQGRIWVSYDLRSLSFREPGQHRPAHHRHQPTRRRARGRRRNRREQVESA